MDVERSGGRSGIADAVRQAEVLGKRRSWRKVTSLLSNFGLYNLTDGSRARIGDALAAAGLLTEPSMQSVSRSGSVRLSLRESALSNAPVASDGLPPGVTLWTWSADGPSREVGEGSTSTGRKLLVDVVVDETIPSVRQYLLALLPGLAEPVLDDLLQADLLPSFKPLRSENRRASVFLARYVVPDEARPSALEIQRSVVELAVGPSWIIVARHPAQRYVNGGPVGDLAVPASDIYMAELAAFDF